MIKKKKESNLKRFTNGFDILCTSKNKFEVWNDLMSLFAIEISNTAMRPLKDTDSFSELWQERETEYLNIMSKYNKKEARIIAQMFTLLVFELEDMVQLRKFDDVLGKLYTTLGLADSKKAQTFTPYDVCRTMANITIDKVNIKQAIKEKGYIKISDSACGAGATLIASIEKCDTLFNKLNYQNHVMYICQDIDDLCVKMCYIQLSLLGVCAIIKHGDTLSNPIKASDLDTNLKSLWFTPVFYTKTWQLRFLFHGGLRQFI